MRMKNILIALAAIIIFAGGYYVISNNSGAASQAPSIGNGTQNRYGMPTSVADNTMPMGTTTNMQEGDGMDMMQSTQYTLADVATHASASDCYMAVNGSVYNLTDYIARSTHKAGMAVVSAECGKDATTIFNLSHPGRKATKAYDQLAGYYIGTLVQ